MTERVQKKKAPAKSETEEVTDLPGKSEKGEALKAELDELLDEIDDLLEENAEEFVAGYRQRGGQ